MKLYLISEVASNIVKIATCENKINFEQMKSIARACGSSNLYLTCLDP